MADIFILCITFSIRHTIEYKIRISPFLNDDILKSYLLMCAILIALIYFADTLLRCAKRGSPLCHKSFVSPSISGRA